MRDGGRISAVLDVLRDFDSRRVPLKVCLADWHRGARYAGAKDRAFVSGLALDVLRHKGSLLAAADGELEGAVALTLRHFWGWEEARILAAYAEEPHGPGALGEQQTARLSAPLPGGDAFLADVPEFVLPMLERISDDPAAEIAASSERAPIDLRVNTLKSDTDRVLKAFAGEGAQPGRLSATALRITPPPSETRGPAIDIHPAFQKGWVEVQDEGSQLAALAAGPIDGAQVLDFCAGGGGKTLALAALMANRGQIHAYDSDARRLAPLFERARRAGVRNLQVISPAEGTERLEALAGKMDLVFVDAPCSGAGTWRRRPDTKWRLTESQLAARMAEQDEVLSAAARFVKPGGVLIYVTCSPFAEENEDRVAAFLNANQGFTPDSVVSAIKAAGGLAHGAEMPAERDVGTLRLTPARSGTDGFVITRLVKSGE